MQQQRSPEIDFREMFWGCSIFEFFNTIVLRADIEQPGAIWKKWPWGRRSGPRNQLILLPANRGMIGITRWRPPANPVWMNSGRMGLRIAPHPFELVIGHFDSYKWPERLWSDWPPSTGKRMVVPMVSQLAFSPVILCPKITSSEKMSFGR
jgi:hypothetical protein